MAECGPMVCDFPDVSVVEVGRRWRCPRCGTEYVKRGIPGGITLWNRLMRRLGRGYWEAPNGFWTVA